MKIWVISDTHFYHTALEEGGVRPSGITSLIIHNWKELVAEEDLVIHLGDVSWDSTFDMHSLPGRKVLVLGNHDKATLTKYLKGFDFVCDSFTLNWGGLDLLFTHKPSIFHEHDLNIHGHLHDLATIDSPHCQHYLIALELNHYRPELLKTIITRALNEKRLQEKLEEV